MWLNSHESNLHPTNFVASIKYNKCLLVDLRDPELPVLIGMQ